MSQEPCSDASCESAAFPHYHTTIFNSYGDACPCTVSLVDLSNGGQVIRDPETGEILFAAQRRRLRVVSDEDTPLTIPTSQALEAAKTALEWFTKHRASIEAGVRSAHSNRGNGASQWMREDDLEFRGDLSRAFDAAESARQALADLSHVPEGEEGGSLPPIAPEDRWQPIETAPMDGTSFLACAAVFNALSGRFSHWDYHVVWCDDETGEIDNACEQGWPLQDYEAWQLLPVPPTLQQASMDGSELKAPSPTPQDGWRPERAAIITEINMCILPKRIRAANPHARFVKNVVEADIIVCIADAILALPSANSGVG